jgi:hypothetical protein
VEVCGSVDVWRELLVVTQQGRQHVLDLGGGAFEHQLFRGVREERARFKRTIGKPLEYSFLTSGFIAPIYHRPRF